MESGAPAAPVEGAVCMGGCAAPGAGAAADRSPPPLLINQAQGGAGLRIFEESCVDVARVGPSAFRRAVGPHEAGPEAPQTARTCPPAGPCERWPPGRK